MKAVRSLFFTIVFILVLLVFKAPVFAQTSSIADLPQDTISTQNQYLAPNTNPDVPRNLHTYTQNVMIEVLSSLLCQVAGVDPINPTQSCLGVDIKTKKIGYVQGGGGALGVMSQGIAILYTPALHTGDYIRYLGQSFGIAKPAHAQGVGFDALSPIIPLWTTFRNVSYLFFILIFIVIGVGIMLRSRIDPRTVMTIQNQIPKIIISLILITFSFAIAGFLIDLMYITIYIVYGLLATSGNVSSLSPAVVQGQNVLQAAGSLEKIQLTDSWVLQEVPYNLRVILRASLDLYLV